MLLEGQCAMPMPQLANCCVSALSSMQQCANHTSSLSQPTSLAHSHTHSADSLLAQMQQPGPGTHELCLQG